MPAENPLFGKWNYEKFSATVLNDIWPEVTFFTLFATIVTIISEKTKVHLSTSTQLLTVLGTVLGLVISFRTSTAYERYQEGRKLWTNLAISIRNLAQIIWIHVPSEREIKDGQPETTFLQHVIEKKTMINLLQAFPVALKHYLRGEPGIYYRDLYPLVCVLPRYVNAAHPLNVSDFLLPFWHVLERNGYHPDPEVYHTPANHNPRGDLPRASSLPTPEVHHAEARSEISEAGTGRTLFSPFVRNTKPRGLKRDPESALADIPSFRPLRPARMPPNSSISDYIPLLRLFKWLFRRATIAKEERDARRRKRRPERVESNVPLEIVLHLNTYSSWLMKNNLLQPALATSITVQITAIQDVFSNLDRIVNTPLPFAYQVHLRVTLWLYLLFLPFQLWSSFHWVTIPATAFASFLLLGFLEIGQEIENPFNYDPNDLDLDSFCLSIQRELQEITAHTAPDPHGFVFTGWNQPFAPYDRRTAEQLCQGGAKLYRTPPHEGEKHHHDHTDHSSRTTKEQLHLTLLQNWRRVDSITREKHQ